jgi:glycosyltransferase involved in cell wall biosynthesis
VKLALVTTPPSVRSGIGDYTRHLLPFLREHAEIEVFVQQGIDQPGWGSERARLAAELDPRRFDQVLYQLGNEQAHAFMPRMIRAIGGTVALHDWVLFDLAMAAWPGLLRGGARGHALALREGGLRQTQVYLRNWLDRRRERREPTPPLATEGLPGALLFGWHAPETNGRWTTDFAALRIPSDSVRNVRFELHLDSGRSVRIHEGSRVLCEERSNAFELQPLRAERPELVLETLGVCPSLEQRKHGDARRLGCVVRRLSWQDEQGEHELDLNQAPAVPLEPVSLSRDRFDLALNRSVVRFADAFICHSRYVAAKILQDRNAETPFGILPHGSENRWRSGERGAARRALGLSEEWARSFLVVSFGGVQPHKRIDKTLQALALARQERADIRLILAGSIQGGGFDPASLARHLGLSDAVRFTGYLPERDAWDWLHAGDIAINLRGPTTGGTSGGIYQAFSMGRSVIASDAAEQQELPRECVVHVPIGVGEVAALARQLVALRDDPEWRERLERNVRAYVESQCHWKVVARQYHEYLASFPRPRASRRRLIALRLGLQRSAL